MADQERTPAAEVAHALLDEISQAHTLKPPIPRRTPPEGSSNNSRPRWHWPTLLTAIIAAGTIAGVLGRAFYVTRGEYTTSDTANAVAHESIKVTLDRVDRNTVAQTQAMAKMSEALQAQAVELAAIRVRVEPHR